MSIEISVKQKGIFNKKPLPLDVILGESLKYGYYDGFRLERDTLGEKDFVAYHPGHIGRGISVVWKQGEKSKVDLRLLTPACDEEVEDFYECVTRIAKFWENSVVEVEGNPGSLEECLNGKEHMLDWNHDVIAGLREEKSLEQAPLILMGAFWPISLSAEDLQQVSQGSAAYRDYMHQKQSMDVYYGVPRFYKDEQGLFGAYTCSEDTRSIFPSKAQLPFWADKSLQVDRWKISLFSFTVNDVIGIIDYEQFLKSIPEDKKQPYDADHILVEPLGWEILMQMAGHK